MINTILFDFGDVFINLNLEASKMAFAKLGLHSLDHEITQQSELFEKGKISELEFIQTFQKKIPNASIEDIRGAWNAMIGDFPLERLEFLQFLKSNYRLFLLTNTDAIHLSKFEHSVGMSFSGDFYRCFEKVYYSFEMGMRKPDPEIFQYIIKKHDLNPARTLFVDDKKENTDAAANEGLHVWNLEVGKEDVVNLFSQNNLIELFGKHRYL